MERWLVSKEWKELERKKITAYLTITTEKGDTELLNFKETEDEEAGGGIFPLCLSRFLKIRRPLTSHPLCNASFKTSTNDVVPLVCEMSRNVIIII